MIAVIRSWPRSAHSCRFEDVISHSSHGRLWDHGFVNQQAQDSLGARWDHVIGEWGLELALGVVALALVLVFVLDDPWWAVASTALGAALWLPLAVKMVRSFRHGFREGD
jgi:hypothetical protein